MGAEPSFDYDSNGATVSIPTVAVILRPGESVLLEERVWAGWGRRTPLARLVVTDRRLLLLTHRLFGRDRMVEIDRQELIAVSAPGEDGFVDVRYVAPAGSEAVVRLAAVRTSSADLVRALNQL